MRGGMCRGMSATAHEAFLDRVCGDLDVTSGTGIPLAVRKRLERGGQVGVCTEEQGRRQLGWLLGHWAVHYGGGGPPSGLCGVQRWYAGTISRILRWAPAA